MGVDEPVSDRVRVFVSVCVAVMGTMAFSPRSYGPLTACGTEDSQKPFKW